MYDAATAASNPWMENGARGEDSMLPVYAVVDAGPSHRMCWVSVDKYTDALKLFLSPTKPPKQTWRWSRLMGPRPWTSSGRSDPSAGGGVSGDALSAAEESAEGTAKGTWWPPVLKSKTGTSLDGAGGGAGKTRKALTWANINAERLAALRDGYLPSPVDVVKLVAGKNVNLETLIASPGTYLTAADLWNREGVLLVMPKLVSRISPSVFAALGLSLSAEDIAEARAAAGVRI